MQMTSEKIPLQLIAVTGSNGTLGKRIPKGYQPLRSRLETPVTDRVAELHALPELPRVMIHLAAMTVVAEAENDPERALALNAEGSLRWAHAAREAGVERFVHVSTAHVYGPKTDRSRLTVDSPLAPSNAYGHSKLEAERRLLAFAETSKPPAITIARVFSVLSPDLPPGFLYPALIDRARRRDFSPIRGLDSVRDFLTPEQIAEQLLRLARSEAPPKIANICSGRETTIREVAAKVFRDHGLDPAALVAAPPGPGDVPYAVGEPTPF
jgi:GDP-4-dehydro-6-deoxy-D-mannose reductase